MIIGILTTLFIYLLCGYGTFRAWLWLFPPKLKEHVDWDYRTEEDYVVRRYYVVDQSGYSLNEAFRISLGLWWVIVLIYFAKMVAVFACKFSDWLEDLAVPKKYVIKDSEKGEGVR